MSAGIVGDAGAGVRGRRCRGLACGGVSCADEHDQAHPAPGPAPHPAAGADPASDPTTAPAAAPLASHEGRRVGAAPTALRSAAIPLTGFALGIDVGGTGVKAALVDLATAELVTARVREKTPQPSTPEAVLETVAAVVERVLAEHQPPGEVPIGCGLPGAIKHGHMKTAANLDKGWIDFDATTQLSERLGRPVYVINDADAAGMAELAYGEASDQPGHGHPADRRHGHRQRPHQ